MAKKFRKRFIRSVHLQAAALLIIYTFLSKFIFYKSVVSSNLIIVFLGPYVFGVAAGIIFLYLFNHEDFFHFVREVEKQERSREKKYLKKYLHYGRIVAVLIIATIGGPVFSALTIRFLLNNVWYRYLLIMAGNIASTILAVLLGKGALSLIAGVSY